ncbi:MAG: hypothetical protein AAF456_25905 [Planctomycetota bacterium]
MISQLFVDLDSEVVDWHFVAGIASAYGDKIEPFVSMTAERVRKDPGESKYRRLLFALAGDAPGEVARILREDFWIVEMAIECGEADPLRQCFEAMGEEAGSMGIYLTRSINNTEDPFQRELAMELFDLTMEK